MEQDNKRAAFNLEAAALPDTDFAHYLDEAFGIATARNVFKVFQGLGLPAPEKKQEFLAGTAGGLVFLSRYGVVIRIEEAESEFRFNNNAWILNPLATINAGEALIEICPGCHMEKDMANALYLEKELRTQQIDFWDVGIRNVGRLPFKTPLFPDGVPVVVDRLAVAKLALSIEPARRALKNLRDKALRRPVPPEPQITEAERQAAEAQKKLYDPLKVAFEVAWPDLSVPPDAGKMKKFWELCLRFVQENKLVAGWDEIDRNNFREDAMKTLAVTYTAEAYEIRLNAAEPRTAPATAPAPRPSGA